MYNKCYKEFSEGTFHINHVALFGKFYNVYGFLSFYNYDRPVN